MPIILWLQHRSVVAMLLVFSLLVMVTYWPGRKRNIEDHGQIPLQDDR
ncbi:MAG: cbb3-type cytochrome c oxidase subunit 3 [Rhodospirillales bacterium]|nr:cbb3-type cytochrome c oxidase subunit 3 [Rhodospirillales bacterium]MDE2574164.1 cbb3-type cytochrome c oxidase subunit 3 [Rhodospirillales bacterium]